MKNKVWAIVLSAVVAFSLWLYVITVVSPGSEETYYDIPIILQNENVLAERGLMITAIDDSTVTMKLEGNRTDLNNLNESNINLLANVSGIMAPGTHLVSYTTNFPGNIASNAVTTQSKSPDMLSITVENQITKDVEVVIDYLNAVPAGFLADKENVQLDYTTIKVTGPESVVSQIANARVQVDLEGKNDAIVGAAFPYTLCNAKKEAVDTTLITADVNEIQMNLKIQKYKELRLQINVVTGGGATEENTTITVNPKTVKVAGSDVQLENLEELELGTVNLGEILEDETLKMPIVLPEGVTNITGLSEATVDVKFNGLETRTVEVKQINPVNVPAGMEADVITESLEVTLRGPTALISAIQETDVIANVDFTGAQEGTATISATIQLTGIYAEVGALGTYDVTATVQKAKVN